jgi:hypothetical protein
VGARGSSVTHGSAYRGASGYDCTHGPLTGGGGCSLKGGDGSNKSVQSDVGGGRSDSDDVNDQRGRHVIERGRCESSQRWARTTQPGWI